MTTNNTQKFIFELPVDVTTPTQTLSPMATSQSYTLEIWFSTVSAASSTTDNWHDWEGAKSECTLQVKFETGSYGSY